VDVVSLRSLLARLTSLNAGQLLQLSVELFDLPPVAEDRFCGGSALQLQLVGHMELRPLRAVG
tara:strand:+ start:304 stop:492 length:189 start_codon:yes stop_codon:yes gene_type:complete